MQAPFTDAAALKAALVDAYADHTFGLMLKLWRVENYAELLATPASCNSGRVTTLAESWLTLFPFVDRTPGGNNVAIDDVAIGGEGYTVIVWARWSGTCVGAAKFPSGAIVDLTGHSFSNLRYCYRLTFDRATGRVALFEGLYDIAEWGRIMGSPHYALLASTAPVYPA